MDNLFHRFVVYWSQTEKHKDIQAKYNHIDIENNSSELLATFSIF